MHRAIGGRRRCAVGQEFVHEAVGNEGRVLGRLKLLLLDEDVGVQPFEELRTVGGDRLCLREMQVRIDETGHYQMRPMIGDLYARPHMFRHVTVRTDAGDLAFAHENGAVLEETIGAGIVDARGLLDESQHAAADQLIAHWTFPSVTVVSYQLAISWRSSSVMPVTLAGGMACERPACR